ncbi:phosphatase PAP2/dual specificity phosphatase family protein [Neptuniibacter sp. PT8_73]|uniref:phosphatase PAP2/dual specificity phosphatase family protein n=1 Tax=Neptuniibacter sp. PT8_73 TaxID=3398206 RepID=UPI0039F5FAE3
MNAIQKSFIEDNQTALWPRALKWLLFLGPLFFITYGAVNTFTATREDVGQIVFAWEQHIPFWDWSIVPYMSIDLLYALSLFICSSKAHLDRHGSRLLLATLVSVVCFLIWPLQFTLTRPETSGFYGSLFDLLTSFDKPYNQAPSLHISLLVLIWMIFNQQIKNGFCRWMMHGWMLLIGVSVLTTWQHHFIDVIGGLVVALFLTYLVPDNSFKWRWEKHQDSDRWRLAVRYALATVLLVIAAFTLEGWAWLLLWPAVSLTTVSIAYAGVGTAVFQHDDNRMSIAAAIMLAPHLVGARVSAYLFSLKRADQVEVIPNIWLGCVPSFERRDSMQAILNVTAEMSPRIPQTDKYRRVPMLDLVTAEPEQFEKAVMELDQLTKANKPVLIHCALGLSRSALVVAGWLLLTAKVQSVDDALEWVKQVRSGCVITESQKKLLSDFASKHSEVGYGSL